MTGWEYLFLEVEGHNRSLDVAQNTLVTASDGRWQNTRMPKDVSGLFNQLGAEGWEMVGGSYWTLRATAFDAVFKRPRP